MSEPSYPAIIRLEDEDLMLEDPQDDVRSARVIDSDGQDIGKVDGLLVDETEKRVRFLEVGSGGFLGIGKSKRLIPVDAVTSIDDDVHVDMDREHIGNSPEYDPEVVPAPEFYPSIYGYYGYSPFWGAGYVYPPYPYR